MLFKNILSLTLTFGMVLSIPVKRFTPTVSLVPLETIPNTNENVEVIRFYSDRKVKRGDFNDVGEVEAEEQIVVNEKYEAKENDAKEAPKEEAKKEDAKKEDAKKEDAKKEDAKKEETKKEEAKKEDAKKEEAPKEEAKKEEAPKEAVIPIQEEPPFIPENEEPEVDTHICSRDLLLMGNKIEEHSVCDEIYDACTEKELISIIIYYYSKNSPVSIEYTIFEGMNKGSITEQCGNILINSKIFQ